MPGHGYRSSLVKRNAQVAKGNCFVCGQPIEVESNVDRTMCLSHFIRRYLRERKTFYTKSTYKNPNSRVRRERLRKRLEIISYLRSRYIAVNRKHVPPFDRNIREVLFFIDKMWSDIGLYHSYPLRAHRLVEFVELIFHLDRLASRGWGRRGWVGSPANRGHSPEQKARRQRDRGTVDDNPLLPPS